MRFENLIIDAHKGYVNGLKDTPICPTNVFPVRRYYFNSNRTDGNDYFRPNGIFNISTRTAQHERLGIYE